jgi:hypothetical protein
LKYSSKAQTVILSDEALQFVLIYLDEYFLFAELFNDDAYFKKAIDNTL